MKYEYLCGYESDFFTMPENVIAIVRLDHCVQGLTEFNQITECGKQVIAMRRIIKEPKRWTWEDKKAGRLPEVGSLIMEVESQYGFEFVGVCAGSKRFAVKDVLDGLIYFYNKDVISPIETPAEKAARLKSEWCAKAAKQLKNLEYTSTLTSIYDALLSGELQAPKGGGNEC